MNAKESQEKFCHDKKLPMFAPDHCWRCHKDVFGKHGVTEEEAESRHIIYCPFCHKSFIDRERR